MKPFVKEVRWAVFPPKDEWDVAAYYEDDIVDGYLDHRHGDDPPGGNRPPGYRWRWANARKDATRIPDGFENIRRAYIEMTRRPN